MKTEPFASLRPLRQFEKDLKEYYQYTGLSFPDHAISADQFAQMLKDHPPKKPFSGYASRAGKERNLEEISFFADSQNATVVQHVRYLPPVLHVQSFFELECVLEGKITCYIGDRKILLQQGDVLILAPNTNHSAATYEDSGIMVNLLVRSSTFEEHFLNLLPAESLLHQFFKKALYDRKDTPYLIFHTAGSDLLTRHIPALVAESEKNRRYKNSMLSAMVSVFLVELMRRHEQDVVVPSEGKYAMNEDTVFILQYLQNNNATITLSDLAGFFNYSERQLQRIILDVTGATFSDNIRNLRIANVKKLLESTNLTVADIAEKVGYYDASNLRHEFKKYCGMTPKEYRDRFPVPFGNKC